MRVRTPLAPRAADVPRQGGTRPGSRRRFWWHSLRPLVAVIVVGVTAVTASAGEVRVMTRNLYLGTDLTPLLVASTPGEFLAAAAAALAEVAATNFPERAAAIADEIAVRRPHLVALQEVIDFTLGGSSGPVPFRDYLADLLDALAARHAHYAVAAVVENLALPITLPGVGEIRILDRDVILARTDVTTAVVPVALLCAQASVDGCNYQVVAVAVTPFGTIPIERGFVAVDATIDGVHVRFANTHLEVKDEGNPASGFVQAAQAAELLALLAALPTPSGAETLVAGDLNSSPLDPVVMVNGGAIVPPYLAFVTAGYTDVWTRQRSRSPGFTCCELPDLSNPTSIASERIDLVFSLTTPSKAKAKVTGNRRRDKTFPSRLWPSDHAGVAANIEFQP